MGGEPEREAEVHVHVIESKFKVHDSQDHRYAIQSKQGDI